MSKSKELPSLEILNDLLELREDFTLWWKVRPAKYFNTKTISKEQAAVAWNNQYSGTQAFNVSNSNGYLIGSIFKKKLLSHRIIWKMYYGYDPDQIDHIDGNRYNNNILNLRNTNSTINSKNLAMPKNNSSGYVGIRIIKRNKADTYQAYINADRQQIYLGTYKTLDEAILARKEAEIKYGFHVNHGRKSLTS